MNETIGIDVAAEKRKQEIALYIHANAGAVQYNNVDVLSISSSYLIKPGLNSIILKKLFIIRLIVVFFDLIVFLLFCSLYCSALEKLFGSCAFCWWKERKTTTWQEPKSTS